VATKHERTNDQSQYDHSEIYQLFCTDCNMKYVGQTRRSFRERYRVHFHYFKYHNTSNFATHLLENSHSTGPIDDIMEILHITRKSRIMDKLEKFHIHIETRNDNQINDKNTIKPNAIFDAISSYNTQ
jgi:hypothetical protein